MRTLVVLVCASTVSLASCATEVVTRYPCERCDASPDDAPDAAGDAPESDGSGGEPAWVGNACATPADCGASSRTCVTETLLGTFGLTGAEVPGGMCSRLACTADSDCGPEGYCFNAQALTGTNIAICLRTCATTDDCARPDENYTCFNRALVLPDEEGGVCLSDDLALAIVSLEGE